MTNSIVIAIFATAISTVLGALVAYPIRRMGTLALALATFALAWVMYFIVFANDDVGNGTFGYTFRYPSVNVFGIKTFDSRGVVVGERRRAGPAER